MFCSRPPVDANLLSVGCKIVVQVRILQRFIKMPIELEGCRVDLRISNLSAQKSVVDMSSDCRRLDACAQSRHDRRCSAAAVDALLHGRTARFFGLPPQPAVAVDALLHGRTDILFLWCWSSRQMPTLRFFLFEQSTDADGRECSNLLLSYSKKKCHPANGRGRSRHGSS